jgi:signal transduction histidine kinase/DNA-binding NarL/FixJ family response regulator/PAS domain-containing protein
MEKKSLKKIVTEVDPAAITRRFLLSLVWIAFIGCLGFMTRFSESRTQTKNQMVIDLLEIQESLTNHIAIVVHSISLLQDEAQLTNRLRAEFTEYIHQLDENQRTLNALLTHDTSFLGNVEGLAPFIYQSPPNLFGMTTGFLASAKRIESKKSVDPATQNSDLNLVSVTAPKELQIAIQDILNKIKLDNADSLQKGVQIEYGIYLSLIISLIVIAKFLFIPAMAAVHDYTKRQIQTNDSLERQNTELANSKESLKQQARILRVMLDGMHEAAIVTNEFGQVTLTNFASENLFGVIPEGQDLAIWMQRTSFTSEIKSGNGESVIDPPIPWVISGGKYSERHLLIKNSLHKHGVHVSLEARAFRDDESSYKGAIFTFADLTSVLAQNREIEQAYRQAEMANQAKTNFLANMSHEIRTPISIIIGYVEKMLMAKASASNIKESLQTVIENAKLLKELVDGILDISKIESGQLEVESVRVSISNIVSDTLSILSDRAKEKNLRLNFTLESEVPETILTDPMRLRQILINVIANAIKFSERGAINVRIRSEQPKSNNKSVQIQFIVTDTGIGISEEGIKRLFSPFVQADSSMARKYGGTGLGLVLSQKLAMALGGDLKLSSSSVNVGSTFVISVNSGDLTGVPWIKNMEFTTKIPEATVEDYCATRPIENLKILIADDVREIRELYSYFLEYAGASVFLATNGFEAIQIAAELSPDVILMDIQMPVVDGYQATKKLREKGYPGYIFALTAHALKEEKDRCLDSGFDDYLIKPIQPKNLIETLQNLRTTQSQSRGNPSMQTARPQADSFIESIQRKFFKELKGRSGRMREAVNTQDWSEVRSIAHQIRGTAGALSCQVLSSQAGKIEDSICRSESEDKISLYCTEFEHLAERFTEDSMARMSPS